MDNARELVRAKILFKLARRRNWGNSHTAFNNLKKGFKPHEHMAVKIIAKGLIKENLLLEKQTHYGLHVSLNHNKTKEIKKIINDFFGEI